MPTVYSYLGYRVYFWVDDFKEPVHVHVCKGSPKPNATKFWIARDGAAVLAKNSSRIKKAELLKLQAFISYRSTGIVAAM